VIPDCALKIINAGLLGGAIKEYVAILMKCTMSMETPWNAVYEMKDVFGPTCSEPGAREAALAIAGSWKRKREWLVFGFTVRRGGEFSLA